MDSEIKDSGAVEFKPPENFQAPEGSGDKEWEMVCTFRTKPDGTVCMTKLGDTEMPIDDDYTPGNQAPKPDYKQYASPMMSAGGDAAAAA